MMYRLLVAVASVCLCLAAGAQTDGPVTIGGVTYERVDPGEAFTAAPELPQDWAAPEPTAAEAAAGMIPYAAEDPGFCRPYRRPKTEERLTRLRSFLTPGEDEPVCFAVYSLTALQGLTVTVDTGGTPVTVDVRHAHCWPQRTGWRSRQWYITPELLLPCADGKKTVPTTRGLLTEVPFDVPAEQTTGFWLTLSAPAGAKAGTYAAKVTVTSTERAALELPLEIEVLPFTLQRPADRWWLLYADVARWGAMSDEQIVAELRDYRRHGMDGLVEIPLGQPDLSRIREGIVTYDASSYRRYAALAQQAGMAGPHVVGSAGVWQVNEALGAGANLGEDDWPQAVKEGVAAVAKAAMEATRDVPAPWYYYGVDEPSGDNTYAIQDYQCWHAGGARTYATFYNLGFLEKAAEFLTAPCFVSGLISNAENARQARETCAKTGAEFWWYGTGSYVNPFPQEGFVWHNRYGAGLLFWKSGAKAEVSWTFCRPHEDVFNDFDGSAVNSAEPKEQATAYPHLLRPDDYSTYQGAIPTLAWEGLREGVDDYLYLYTLTQTIAAAKASPQEAVRQLASEAETEIQALVDAVPWANCMGPNGFPTTRLQQLRRVAADRTVALQAALAGQATVAPRKVRYPLAFELRTEAAPSTASLPVLPLLPTASAPVIDGKLSDACWQSAAVADGFRDTWNGGPVTVQTEARLLADDTCLYAGFRCAEPRMADVRARATAHDGEVWLEDSVELFVAGAARRPYAHLIVSSAGVVLDERNQDAAAWDPGAAVAVSRGDNYWMVEMAIPWAKLAEAGVMRGQVMALNFGRNRHTGRETPEASAWSVTYGGFHTPERFGLALQQTGTVALADLDLPTGWGRQEVRVSLRNLTDRAVAAEVALRGSDPVTLRLPARAVGTVSLPANLRTPGQRDLRLTWGVVGGQSETAELPVVVPPPAELVASGGLVTPGEMVRLPVRLSLSEREQARHSLRLRLASGSQVANVDLPARAGQVRRTRLAADGPVVASLALVGESDRCVWQGAELRYVALPES
ncbi:MAG: carbohydrate-binding family 9-like protein [Armatimonadetes bacterium]|nr:carbohydrate-binding family 9-like protein [Armatimonadota bacterium]